MLLLCVSLMLTFFLISATSAQSDGRINPAPYHFGGDALYCNNTDGCRLLDKTGNFLWNWSQEEIGAAFEALDASGQNTLVEEGVGSYGPAQLWAVLPETNSVNKRLCLFAYDEWGKQNYMCFGVTAGWVYLPLRLAPAVPVEGTPEPVPDCSMWSTSEFVRLIADPDTWGEITSINAAAGEVTFTNYGGSNEPITAGCDEIEITYI